MGIDPNSKLARRRERDAAMTDAWPGWRIAYKILGRPPWQVMKWLRDFRAALLGGVETFERHIACGGLAVEIEDDCDCQKSLDPTVEARALVDVMKSITKLPMSLDDQTARLADLYGELEWLSSDTKRRIRQEIRCLNPSRDNGDLDVSDALAWLHAHHRAYNRAQRRLIETTIGLPAFREILERNQESLGTTAEWGTILLKSYAGQLLRKFVNSNAWC